jgi:hypothetical protein
MPTAKEIDLVIRVKPNSGGLNEEEARVMDALVKAWNELMKIEGVLTIEETAEFRDGIHQCQDVLMKRAIKRIFPKFWR